MYQYQPNLNLNLNSFCTGILLGSLGTVFIAHRIYISFLLPSLEHRFRHHQVIQDDSIQEEEEDNKEDEVVPRGELTVVTVTPNNNKNTRHRKALALAKKKKKKVQKISSHRYAIFNISRRVFFNSNDSDADDDNDDDNSDEEDTEEEEEERKTIVNTNTNPTFFTSIMAELWPHMKVAGATKIKTIVEPKFNDMPTPMQTCRFTKIDLGDIPLQMNNIVVHSNNNKNTTSNNSNNSCVQWEFDFVWDGMCDIELQADYIGKFGIKELKIQGRISIMMKPLLEVIPVVSCLQYSFINMPAIDLWFTGFGSRLTSLPMIKQSVVSAIQASLQAYCLPNRSLYPVSIPSPATLYFDTYTKPIGIVRIWVESGRGFVVEKKLIAKDDIPDVYLQISLGCHRICSADNDTDENKEGGDSSGGWGRWRTPTIDNDCNPHWSGLKNTVRDFIIYDKCQTLTINAWDEDSGPFDPDDDLGTATLSVNELLSSSSSSGGTSTTESRYRTELPLVYQHRKTGASVTLSCQFGEWETTSCHRRDRDPDPDQVQNCDPDPTSSVEVTSIPTEFTTAMSTIRQQNAGNNNNNNNKDIPSIPSIPVSTTTSNKNTTNNRIIHGLVVILVNRIVNLTTTNTTKQPLMMKVRIQFNGNTYNSHIVDTNSSSHHPTNAEQQQPNHLLLVESSFSIPLILSSSSTSSSSLSSSSNAMTLVDDAAEDFYADDTCIRLELIDVPSTTIDKGHTLPAAQSTSFVLSSPTAKNNDSDNDDVALLGSSSITFGEIRRECNARNGPSSMDSNSDSSAKKSHYTWTGKRRLEGTQISTGSLEFQILLSDRVAMMGDQQQQQKKKKIDKEDNRTTTTTTIKKKQEDTTAIVQTTPSSTSSFSPSPSKRSDIQLTPPTVSSSAIVEKKKTSTTTTTILSSLSSSSAAVVVAADAAALGTSTLRFASSTKTSRSGGSDSHDHHNNSKNEIAVPPQQLIPTEAVVVATTAVAATTTTVRMSVLSVRGLGESADHTIPSVYCVIKIGTRKQGCTENQNYVAYYNDVYQTSTKVWNTTGNDDDVTTNNTNDDGDSHDFLLHNDDCINNKILVKCEVWDTTTSTTGKRILLVGELGNTSLQKFMPPSNTTTTTTDVSSSTSLLSSTSTSASSSSDVEFALQKKDGTESGIYLTLQCSYIL